MTQERIAAVSIPERIAGELTDELLAAPEDQPLPSEQDLALRFTAIRAAVSEAILLKAKGLIRSEKDRQFATRPADQAALVGLPLAVRNPTEILNLTELRLSLETQKWQAQRETPGDI